MASRDQAFSRATRSRCEIPINSSPFRIESSAASFRTVEIAPVSPPLASRTCWTISRRERSDGFLSGSTRSKAARRRQRLSLSLHRGISNWPVAANHLRIGLKCKNCVARPTRTVALSYHRVNPYRLVLYVDRLPNHLLQPEHWSVGISLLGVCTALGALHFVNTANPCSFRNPAIYDMYIINAATAYQG
jgi:hypothetical protein